MYESRKNLPFLTKLNAKPKVSLNPLQSKGAALDPPETLSLDSAGAPPQTLQGYAVPLTPYFAP